MSSTTVSEGSSSRGVGMVKSREVGLRVGGGRRKGTKRGGRRRTEGWFFHPDFTVPCLRGTLVGNR